MSTIIRWIQLHRSTIDVWSGLKLIGAVHSIIGTLRKRAGLAEERSEGHAKGTKTRQRFARPAPPNSLLFLFFNISSLWSRLPSRRSYFRWEDQG